MRRLWPGLAPYGHAEARPVLDRRHERLPNLATTIVRPFSGRSGMTRAKLVRREGGSAESEQSVEDGLDWLVRHQREDGSWGLNFQDHARSAVPRPDRHESDAAAAGLALLPLLGAGYIHWVKSKRQEAVQRGSEWLVDHQQPDGGPVLRPPGIIVPCTATPSPR